MKNRKGFTLIEVIGAIIILGILAVITVQLFTGSLNEFRDDFYDNMEDNLKISGREFFGDNRTYRPNGYLEATKVSINTLNSQKYIDSIIDYEGSECDKDSYVMVVRRGKDNYEYHVCLRCPNDDFDNTVGNIYCDPSWFDTSKLGYTLGEINDIYIYKGTDKSLLEELTKIPVWNAKYDNSGNVLDKVDGSGEENVPEIYPVNLDVVDTSKVGEYELLYKYETSTSIGTPTTVETTAKVIVYENNSPSITVKKTNRVSSNSSSSSDVTTNYANGDWAQKVTITFGRGTGYYDKTETKASKYQWKRGNKWVDVCVADEAGDSCTIQITEEMNEVIYFRMIDSAGNVSAISPAYTFKIDNTPPKANLYVTNGTLGNNGYYKSSSVGLGIQNITDPVGTDPDAVSGVKYYTLNMNEITARSGSHGTITGTQTADTTGTVWYVFVEDVAQNYAIYDLTIKKDSTNPYANWSTPATIDSDGSYHYNAGIDVTAVCRDDTSGPVAKSEDYHVSSPTSRSGKSLSITCTDNAGNTTTLNKTYYVRYKFVENCDKCGAETCTDASCCGTHSCNCYETCGTCQSCHEECVMWDDHPESYHCMHATMVCSPYTCNCVEHCSTCASTCTKNCCGCLTCWEFN